MEQDRYNNIQKIRKYYILSKLRGVPSSPHVLPQENVTGPTPTFKPPDWIGQKDGPPYRPGSEPQGEFIPPVYPSEFIIESQSPQSPFEGLDLLTKQRITNLLREGKITTVEEFEATCRQAANMDFLERESFLSAIECREETQRQEHESSRDSILKKYGLGQFKFRRR